MADRFAFSPPTKPQLIRRHMVFLGDRQNAFERAVVSARHVFRAQNRSVIGLQPGHMLLKTFGRRHSCERRSRRKAVNLHFFHGDRASPGKTSPLSTTPLVSGCVAPASRHQANTFGKSANTSSTLFGGSVVGAPLVLRVHSRHPSRERAGLSRTPLPRL